MIHGIGYRSPGGRTRLDCIMWSYVGGVILPLVVSLRRIVDGGAFQGRRTEC
jgi:hypothetical protein